MSPLRENRLNRSFLHSTLHNSKALMFLSIKYLRVLALTGLTHLIVVERFQDRDGNEIPIVLKLMTD